MKDIFQAAEKWTAVLSQSVSHAAERRGWAAKAYSFLLAPPTAQMVMIVSTTVHLPAALSASFTPRYEPSPGDRSWEIDVRRTDGRVRDSWATPLSITKRDGKYVLMCGAIGLSDELLDVILEDLGTP